MSSSTRYALELSLSGAAAAVAGVRGVGSALGSIGGAVASANQGLFYFAGHLGNISSMAKSLAGGGFSIGKSLVGSVAELEGAQIQFETLLGSAQSARDHIQALLDSPISAAFDDMDVLSGSRQLMLLGGAALGAGDNLKMVADIAAASGADFRTAASAVGRLYANIKSGEGAGDSARVFKSMGLAIGDLDAELERMSANGATTDQLWKKTTDTFSRFIGTSDQFAASMAGQTAALADSWTALKRTIGAPLFDMVRADLRTFNDEFADLLNQDRVRNLLTGLGAVAADSLSSVRDAITGGLKLTDLVDAAEAGRLGEVLGAQLRAVGNMIKGPALEIGREVGREIASGIAEAAVQPVNRGLNWFGSTRVGKAMGVVDYSDDTRLAQLKEPPPVTAPRRPLLPDAQTNADNGTAPRRPLLPDAQTNAASGIVTRAAGAVSQAGADYNRAADDMRRTANAQAEAARQTTAWLATVERLASATAGRMTTD